MIFRVDLFVQCLSDKGFMRFLLFIFFFHIFPGQIYSDDKIQLITFLQWNLCSALLTEVHLVFISHIGQISGPQPLLYIRIIWESFLKYQCTGFSLQRKVLVFVLFCFVFKSSQGDFNVQPRLRNRD